MTAPTAVNPSLVSTFPCVVIVIPVAVIEAPEPTAAEPSPFARIAVPPLMTMLLPFSATAPLALIPFVIIGPPDAMLPPLGQSALE